MPPRYGESGGISSSRRSIGGKPATASEHAELENARGRDVAFRPERHPRSIGLTLDPVGLRCDGHEATRRFDARCTTSFVLSRPRTVSRAKSSLAASVRRAASLIG